MYPKNSNTLFKEIANRTNTSEELVSDYIHFVFSELRSSMSGLKDIIYNIPHIGRFETNTTLVDKEIKRMVKTRNSDFRYNNMKEIGMLVEIRDKTIDEEIRKIDGKLNKLKWHKENGDPYKKYNQEQEENLRRSKELLLKKKRNRGDRKDENEIM